MKHYSMLKDDESKVYIRRGCRNRKTTKYSDTIYTFDIEVSNLFYFNNEWQVFDKTKNKDFYADVPKIGIPYIWQFSVNESVYYGRDLMEFANVLKAISNPDITKMCFIHNLSYEFQFLLNIILDQKWTIENMCCRDVRKPISFKVPEINIEFRCTYMLTNMSLKTASKEFTDVKKLDSLDYDAYIRTPLTHLHTDEMLYAEMDCICVYKIVKYFMNEYEHLVLIPLTSTGQVRKEFKKNVDYFYIRKQQQLVPSRKIYMILWACFAGGYTHSNIINTNIVIKNARSYDISSSYPWQLMQKLPSKPFRKCLVDEFMTNDNYGYIAHIRLIDVESVYYTHYLQDAKCFNKKNCVVDNGRIVSCDMCEIWITSLDYEIIVKNYNIANIEILECYKSFLDYLDIRVLKLVLRLYQNKTKLKGVKGKENIYRMEKSHLNSLYGMCVTNPLKQSAKFDCGWIRSELTEEFIDEKLEEMKNSHSTLMYYGAGVWITAGARKALMDCVLYSHEFDKHVIYCDTDSIKYYGSYDYIFEEYNKKIYDKYKEICSDNPSIKIEDFIPEDNNGVKHPLGYYEIDSEHIEEIKCLGAKKYVVRENGKLHMTLAGVSKKGVVVLNNDINNFKKGLVFDYDTSGKLTHFYNDEQPVADITDVNGNVYHSELRYGITLAPTTYTLGTTDLYDYLMEQFEIKYANERKKENGK